VFLSIDFLEWLAGNIDPRAADAPLPTFGL
jgi:hypothetical protein